MNKPKLCEILGVEVNEAFGIKDCGYDYYVGDDGNLHYSDCDYLVTPEDLCKIINDPDSIIRTPKWTKQDIEDAKAVKRLFTSYDRVTRLENTVYYKGHINSVVILHDTLEWQAHELDNDNCFPSLKQGETVKLDDIINSEV